MPIALPLPPPQVVTTNHVPRHHQMSPAGKLPWLRTTGLDTQGPRRPVREPVKEMVSDSILWWLQCRTLPKAGPGSAHTLQWWGVHYLQRLYLSWFFTILIQNLPLGASIIRSIDGPKQLCLLPFICKETLESWPNWGRGLRSLSGPQCLHGYLHS